MDIRGRNIQKPSGRTMRLLVYLFLCLVMVAGLWRVESRANTAERSAKSAHIEAQIVQAEADARQAAETRQNHDQCVSTNNARTGIRQAFSDLINQAFDIPPTNPRTPEQQAAHDSQRDSFVSQFFAKNLDVNLPLVDCDAVFPVK